jgi:thiol-disulfide isomerase/thioredoxin
VAEVPTTYRLQLSKPGLTPPAILLLPGQPATLGIGRSVEAADAAPSRFELVVEDAGLSLRQLGAGDAVIDQLPLPQAGGSGTLGEWQVALTPVATAAPRPMYRLTLERDGGPSGRSFVVEPGTQLSAAGARFRLESAESGLELQELGAENAVTARVPLKSTGGSGTLGSWQATLTPLDPTEVAQMLQMRETSRLGLVRALQASDRTEPLPTVAHAHRTDLRAADSLLATGQPAALPQTLVFDAEQRLILLSTSYSTLDDLQAKIAAARKQPAAPALTLAQALAAFRHPDGRVIERVPAGSLYLLQAWAPWCAPCLKERDDLVAYFQANPDSDWVWFHAEADAPAFRKQQQD